MRALFSRLPSRSSPPSGRRRVRRGLLLLAPVLYVAGGAVYAGETRAGEWLAIVVASLVAIAGARATEDEPRGADPPEAGERAKTIARARTWTYGATAIAIATSALTLRAAWAASLREIAAAAAAVVAARALRDIEGDAGLGPRATEAVHARGLGPTALARFAAFASGLAWATAATVDALVWLGVSPELEGSAAVLAAACGAIATVILGATALLVAGARRLELAAPPRALACAAAAGVALILAIAFAIAGTMRADAAMAVFGAASTIATVRLAYATDSLRIAKQGRRALTLALFGGPVVTLAAIVAEGRGGGLAALAVACVAMLVGVLAPRLEEPLLPVKGVMLDALADAARAAHDREARAAIAAALSRVREAAGHGATHAELWMLHPTRVLTVDAAGYLQEREGELPPSLLDVALAEPDATVRVDVLRALEVRRADLRPLLRWLEDRRALFATLVSEGEDPDGLILVPAGARTEPLTIEEVRGAKALADAFVAICQARSARERHLARERGLAGRIDVLEDEVARLRHEAEQIAAHNALAASRLARPATVGLTSAASRFAYDALERRVENGAPVVVAAPPGVDPVPYIARAHLAGPRKNGPLVVVDGTSTREHDLVRWRDERTSPLALADRGLLVLVDGAALPRDVQVLVAKCLGERRPPWERATPLDVSLAFTAVGAPEVLVEEGRLAPELAARLGDAAPVGLPRLRDRPEDLFSMVADRLAREGLRVRGRPLGIDAGAFALLVEHPFEGEDAELAAIVSKLVAHARGDVVRAADVVAAGITRPPRSSALAE
jgi:hypothetical protein